MTESRDDPPLPVARLRRVRVAETDLALPAPPPVGGCAGYDAVRVLVRYGGEPLGWLLLPAPGGGEIGGDELRRAAAARLGDGAFPHLLPLPAPREVTSPPVSVVVCTRDRPDLLSECLGTVLALEYPDFEVVVVDNAPADDRAEQVVTRAAAGGRDAGGRVRYVREPVPGLDRARNRGISEARGEVVAFTDDDARPDARWLRVLARAFAEHPDASAVTGYVAPRELETRAQVLFELVYGGMGHGLRPRRFGPPDLTASEALWASGCGVGANMAFRRGVFDAVGGFDPALDVGTPTRGGGDVEMFHRLLARGHTLVYEPAALVWHLHRREMGALRRQMRDNGTSFAAYLCRAAGRGGTPRPAAVVRFCLVSWVGGWLLRRLVAPGGFPRGLVLAELMGALAGPGAYRASRRESRRLDGDAVRGGEEEGIH